MGRFYLLKDFLKFLWRTKHWWLIPVLCLIILLAIWISAASVSPVPIFVYPLI